MNKNLIIRADADTRMGTGHLMRCIALAQTWQDNGGDVTFLSYCESPPLRQRILDEGFDFILIEKPYPDPNDLKKTLSILSNSTNPTNSTNKTNITNLTNQTNSTTTPWLVVDGYHFTPDYQRQIKEAGHRLLVIDDMAHLDHYYADVVLNQNINAETLQYSCEPYTRLLLGTRYVLLRREFLSWKEWKREIPSVARKVLVTLGGGDLDNVTLKVINALKKLEISDLDVRIVVGPSNPNIQILKDALLPAPCSMLCVENANNMPELMAWADIAVTAAGSTCWELAYMGVPFLTIILADNQEAIARGLDEAGAVVSLGWYHEFSVGDFTGSASNLIADEKGRWNLNNMARRLIDGRGTERVIKCMVRK